MIDEMELPRAVTVGALMLGCLVLVTAAADAAHGGYPDAIAVLGHSGATGYDSDPKRSGVVVRENSWATWITTRSGRGSTSARQSSPG